MTDAPTPASYDAAELRKPRLAPHSEAASDAYRQFCQTQEYEDAFREAEQLPGVDTALWIAFARGFAAKQTPYGIVDPDYARVFTIARCIAWSEGYALVMHGSFTRDLDLLAVPWAENATDAEHLVRRIAGALSELEILKRKVDAPSQANTKPHGRLAWTLVFKAFGDPRFVDLSVMPRASDAAKDARIAELERERDEARRALVEWYDRATAAEASLAAAKEEIGKKDAVLSGIRDRTALWTDRVMGHLYTVDSIAAGLREEIDAALAQHRSASENSIARPERGEPA